ncbi:unnamed protein product [Darwinula stevensoni]|uniref:DNA polymerase subunit gamma-1 n=1 Tax=Darwinula stevensoni TaxID=69355 RepID=A0A7R9FPE9_9CRUS|nr:unnamed protein product [Darwinula stevensoni]CAG0897515.1 unnamed protein product [Darwinula stevensoni]
MTWVRLCRPVRSLQRCSSSSAADGSQPVLNPMNIQLLSKPLSEKIFGPAADAEEDAEAVKRCQKELKQHGLWEVAPSLAPEIAFPLPRLRGKDIAEHFESIAGEQVQPYRRLLSRILEGNVPAVPSHWVFQEGWTKYHSDGVVERLKFPDDPVLSFDVEVCMKDGKVPTLATAVSPHAWYSWCSSRLISPHVRVGDEEYIHPHLLISMQESQEPSLIIGHNVSFDRAYISTEYSLRRGGCRFLDTMSLHIAICGLTGYQQALFAASKGTSSKSRGKKEENAAQKHFRGPPSNLWMDVASMNNLKDAYQLHVGGAALEKESRDVFVKGTLDDVRKEFQGLMSYCAQDARASLLLLRALWPEFLERFPSTVTLAGMLEMGSMYLPINRNWNRYLEAAEETYSDMQTELKRLLGRQAQDACSLLHDESYKEDVWLWNLDWTIQDLKVKKTISKRKPSEKIEELREKRNPLSNLLKESSCSEVQAEEELAKKSMVASHFPHLLASRDSLHKRRPFLPGYPAWYRNLCSKENGNGLEPDLLSTSMQLVPRLLRLTWDGHPLHFDPEHGWGYLVPSCVSSSHDSPSTDPMFPYQQLHVPEAHEEQKSGEEGIEMIWEKLLKGDVGEDPADMERLWAGVRLLNQQLHVPEAHEEQKSGEEGIEMIWEKLLKGDVGEDPADMERLWAGVRLLNQKLAEKHEKRKKGRKGKVEEHQEENKKKESGIDIGLPGCLFRPLPHKDGPGKRVGNPLSKDFQSKWEDGTLSTAAGKSAEQALRHETSHMLTYWRNARDRILDQIAVWWLPEDIPHHINGHTLIEPSATYGAILPQVAVCGTVTRRAVEATWLTASNASSLRLGSELKAMIQAPPGFHFVGADVDAQIWILCNQELWIAALIGDAHQGRMHGCTPFGWMTLQGKKSTGTDLHSQTALAIDISRDQAKVLNYARIYGAGMSFAQQLLRQFNHRLTPDDARAKATTIYTKTKGVRKYKLNGEGKRLANEAGLSYSDEPWSRSQVNQLLRLHSSNKSLEEVVEEGRVWVAGTESAMFTELEAIAHSDEPRTPVLKARITRALEPLYVDHDFLTSRVNWVVQSSAVDYLHLLLVAMNHLFTSYGIQGRFAISIHDEVRYLVASEHRYRAALALQVANLWTRAMFAFKLNIPNLPQSVGFFSSVEVDQVLRKDCRDDCRTPSNPHGLHRGFGIPPGEWDL